MTQIVAIGAGRMGRGIGQVFAYAGYLVSIVDFKPRHPEEAERVLNEAEVEIKENLIALSSIGAINSKEIEPTLSRLKYVSSENSKTCIESADYIFEGVPEVIAIKEDVLARVSQITNSGTVIVSTTSTMSANTLAKFSKHPKMFLNAHFLNPAFLIPLVEVSSSDSTDKMVEDNLIQLLKDIGKEPVRCSPAPGYIVPRLQSLLMSEACRMVEEGVASPEEIDKAVTCGLGIRFATMGPLEFVDWGGLDILYYANQYLSREIGSRFDVPAIINEHMKDGNLGLKTGKGMYDFSKIDVEEYKTRKLEQFISLLKYKELMPRSATNRKTV